MQNPKNYITRRVHELYWREDLNCARTTLTCLSELFNLPVEPQTMTAAIGLHGAGSYRAQCGLVEGSLMFIAILLQDRGFSEEEIVVICRDFASVFESVFGSLRCREIRPGGFRKNDPPHRCEKVTCLGIEIAHEYLTRILKKAKPASTNLAR